MTVGALYAAEELGLIYKNASTNLFEGTRKAVGRAMKAEMTHSTWRRPIVVMVPVGDRDQAGTGGGIAIQIRIDTSSVVGHHSHLSVFASCPLRLAAA
jgi:hypothetical protein